MTLLQDASTIETAQPAAARDPAPTDEELRRIEAEPGTEFVDGELKEHQMSMLAVLAATAVTIRVGTAAADAADATVFQDGMGYRCWPGKPNHYRKPDVSVVRTSKLADVELNEDGDVGTLSVVPDLAVEVVSLNDKAGELDEKLMDYAGAGFPEVWVLFPLTRSVTRYKEGRHDAKLVGDDELTLPDLLPSFKATVAELFPHPKPAEPAADAPKKP
jgi:Uma2 family endonuclease